VTEEGRPPVVSGTEADALHMFAVALANPPAGATVLEFGARAGTGSAQVLAHDPVSRAVVVARGDSALRQARAVLASDLLDGRATVLDVDLRALALPPASIGAAFGVDATVFWRSMALYELAALHHALTPGAPLVIAYAPDPTGSATRARAVLATVAAALTSGGFAVEREVIEASGCAVVARRP